ncbi:MAG: NAD-binding protein [Chthonomonadales bacterium]|nr:NAD-binding protein [Chthonomonadales bacterium]
MYIVIVGGGNVGYYLAKALVRTHHEILLMEKDRGVHRRIAEELGEVTMQGDGCEVRLLDEAGVGRADVVVAATGDDEDNLVICQMAKMKFDVPRTIARVNNPRNEDLFHRLGIDATVSSTKIIYNLIEQEIETGEVIPLAALRRGRIEIVEIEIGEKSPVLDAQVQQLHLPAGSLIISVIRSEHAMIPTAETRFEVGDSVIALVTAELEHELRDVFAESRP